MSRGRAPMAEVAKLERRREYMDRLGWWHRFAMLHPRLVPSFVRRASVRAAERAWLDAESALPRRYRRALSTAAMRPSKGRRR